VLAATLLALGSAGLHASWNLILKRAPAADRELTSWAIFLFGGALVAPVAIAMGGPGRAALPWLAASAVVHVAYVRALVGAYRHGDFSLAYPLARGGGALVAAIGGGVLLADDLSRWSWLAIAVVAAGLVSLVGRGISTASLRDASLTALFIGSYTLLDAQGARAATSGLAYGLSIGVAVAACLSAVELARGRGPALRAALPGAWRTWLLAGSCTAVAYAVVLVAMRLAPVGYVAMLRESSVVIGAAIGWLVLHEPLGGHRLASSAVILVGLVGLVVAST
jgi:drug/metabolite transporter (DMT)-like permease